MEKIEKILEFLKVEPIENGYDDGFGFGFGCGYGSGYGDDSGSGYGCGYGDGYGSGSGSGDGDGDGSGSGRRDGYGYGVGNNNIQFIKLYGEQSFLVDGIHTIFEHIRGNIAKCKIIDMNNFTTKDCYVVKNEHYFAHGDTLEQAFADLQDKIFANMDTEQRITEFNKKFNRTDKYKGTEFFEWHHILTGSCLAGRNHFIKSKGLDVNAEYTVDEFIKLCENDYGGRIIEKLKTAK